MKKDLPTSIKPVEGLVPSCQTCKLSYVCHDCKTMKNLLENCSLRDSKDSKISMFSLLGGSCVFYMVIEKDVNNPLSKCSPNLSFHI